MEKRLEITSMNGRRYLFVEWMIFGHNTVCAYSWFSNKWNRLCKNDLSTLEDAEAWVKKLDADYIAWKNAPKVENTMSAESYYSITGYYGD